MNPTRILPDLQCSLLCEEVRQEINGNFMLIGIIGAVHVPQVPITAFKLCLFDRWTAGVGNFTEQVRLIAPDQVTVLRQSQVKFVLKEATHHATNISLFAQVKFETAGVYWIEVLVDDVMKLRYPLLVAVVTPPAGQQQQPVPPAKPEGV
ncbi:MAG: hypothetical protein HYY24_15890 [Verrucomicrobia bacterium]|nr:hypothetical protein [Verrucomicrobiota bacterium]